ncbi:Ubiquitin carboxyl-terminal hydrolase MINDY-3 [Schistosoma japonicum]|nr:Ubiquitin carboxyl-terminal hydrolase MINDY-3 [Schistosoma japonicum]
MDVLLSALLRIILLVSSDRQSHFFWVYWCDDDGPTCSKSTTLDVKHTINDTVCSEPLDSNVNQLSECGFQTFISGLRCFEAETVDELRAVAFSLQPQIKSKYGVLCFLYSVLFTHGLQSLIKEMNGEMDALIDPVHGHASQCLINLLITGESTPYLFDGERDLGGFTLKGVSKQPKTGFLTFVEALRYCEVGWFLKNPYYPVWILGSETHLTVLASPDMSLVSKNLKSEDNVSIPDIRQAEIEFDYLSPDQDTGGFINSLDFRELLTKLQLSTGSLQINDLIARLDPEGLGIILKKDFLQFFFPEEMATRNTEVINFQLIHYNGLEHSNTDGRVRYSIGEARLIDPTEELVETHPVDRSPIQQCLATKWPTIRITWNKNRSPSLN